MIAGARVNNNIAFSYSCIDSLPQHHMVCTRYRVVIALFRTPRNILRRVLFPMIIYGERKSWCWQWLYASASAKLDFGKNVGRIRQPPSRAVKITERSVESHIPVKLCPGAWLNRIKGNAEELSLKIQTRFRPDRRTTEQMFNLRQRSKPKLPYPRLSGLQKGSWSHVARTSQEGLWPVVSTANNFDKGMVETSKEPVGPRLNKSRVPSHNGGTIYRLMYHNSVAI